jgi:hypothetical protein
MLSSIAKSPNIPIVTKSRICKTIRIMKFLA